MPNLVGLDPKYLVDAIGAYKTGQRKNDTMKALLSALERRRHQQHRLFYALQKPAERGPPQRAIRRRQGCGNRRAGCHGEAA